MPSGCFRAVALREKGPAADRVRRCDRPKEPWGPSCQPTSPRLRRPGSTSPRSAHLAHLTGVSPAPLESGEVTIAERGSAEGRKAAAEYMELSFEEVLTGRA